MKQNKVAKRQQQKNRANKNRELAMYKNNGSRPTSKMTKSSQADAVMSTSGGVTRVVHRELIRDIPGSVAFSATGLSVNPGLGSCFPWLSSVAERYESYLFNKLRFIYMHQVSEFTEGNGKVLLAMDYDAADSAPTSKVQMSAYSSEVSCAPYENVVMTCRKSDLDKFGKQRYIRVGDLDSNLDVKTYDVGKFFIATQGQADTDLVGELYVEYDVNLYTPQLQMTPVSAKVVGSAGITKTAPLGTTTVITAVGGSPVSVSSSTVLQFDRAGEYIISTLLTGTGLTALGLTASSGASTSQLNELALAAGTFLLAEDRVRITSSGQTITLDAATGNTTVTNCEIRISQYAYANA